MAPPVQDQRAVVVGRTARIFDAPVGGVNADHLAHESGLEEGEERRGGRDGSSRTVNTLGPEIVLSTTDSHSIMSTGRTTTEVEATVKAVSKFAQLRRRTWLVFSAAGVIDPYIWRSLQV